MSEMDACHWNGQQRVTARHLRDCDAAGCEGCLPCGRNHCTMPRCHHHLGEWEPLVCNRCVGKVRDHLERLGDLCRLAPVAAIEGGVNSDAAVLAGPVPEHSTATARHTWAMQGGLCRCLNCPDAETVMGPACRKTACGHITCERIHGRRVCPALVAWLEDTSDARHPLIVLGGWDMLVTEHFEHRRTQRVTVESAAAYLASNLTDLARHEDFGFDDLAREVESCVEHVENVMAVAIKVQKGAPCPVCHGAGRPAKPLVREWAEGVEDDSRDRWVCPTADCGQTWTLDEYDKYVEREHRARATRLTASQIAAEYRVPEGTVRRWANGWRDRRGEFHEPVVRKRGYDGQRRQLYDVADVETMRDTSTAECA